MLYNVLMTNILLACMLASILVAFVATVLIFIKVRRAYRQFISFITPEADGKPSPAATVAQNVSDMAARSIVAQVKGFLMGLQSGQSRGQTAVTGDIVEGAAGQQLPMIGAVLDSFPALKRTLRRNPALLDLALSKLAGVKSGSNQSQGSNGDSPKFKL